MEKSKKEMYINHINEMSVEERAIAKAISWVAWEIKEDGVIPFTQDELIVILSKLIEEEKISISDLYLHILEIKKLQITDDPIYHGPIVPLYLRQGGYDNFCKISRFLTDYYSGDEDAD